MNSYVTDECHTDEDVMRNTLASLRANPQTQRVAVSREHYIWLVEQLIAASPGRFGPVQTLLAY